MVIVQSGLLQRFDWYGDVHVMFLISGTKNNTFDVYTVSNSFEPRCEKTGLRGFRPGPTQTGLCSHRRWLEA